MRQYSDPRKNAFEGAANALDIKMKLAAAKKGAVKHHVSHRVVQGAHTAMTAAYEALQEVPAEFKDRFDDLETHYGQYIAEHGLSARDTLPTTPDNRL